MLNIELKNLINGSTCKYIYGSSSIDVLLTNKVRSFQSSCTVAAGSDCHKMLLTAMGAHYVKLNPKKI